MQQLYLIHREAAKMKRQRNMSQMKNRTKLQKNKKILRKEQIREKYSIKCRVQHTGYKNAQGTLGKSG